MSEVFIGTSGFSYPHWGGGVFYPKDLPQRKWFEYYCQYFKSVELNVSFYRLPKKEAFAGWRKRAGKDFVFSIKGSRFITHIKKLKDCQEPVKVFFENAEALESDAKTQKDVVLWQLPPGLKADSIRLESFLKILPKTFRPSQTGQPRSTWRHAFELRNQTWLTGDVYQLLKKANAAVVFQDYPDWSITEEITADFVYIRFHGNRELYSSEYTEEELMGWSRKIDKWLSRGLDVYAYFNNDALGYAVPNAKRLKKVVE